MLIKQLDPSGQDVVNEPVYCTETVWIDSTAYYRGALAYIPGPSIAQLGQYGLWTQENKSGNRQTVHFTGLPEPGQVVVDRLNGWVLSDVERTLYADYRAHGPTPIRGNDLVFPFPFLLPNDEQVTIGQARVGQHTRFGYVQVRMGGNPMQDANLYISNGVDQHSMLLPSGTSSYVVELPWPFKVTPQQQIDVWTDNGYGAYDLVIILMGF